MSTDTAILFFTLTTERELETKQVHKNERLNKLLISSIYRRTHRLLKRQPLPVIEFNEHKQVGCSFGERLSNAVTDVFSRGYQQLIIIGNDCPFLSLKDLQKSRRALESGYQVIGKSYDGGAFLIGVSKSSFCHQEFSSLPWTTPYLGAALEKYILQRGPISLLDSKVDLDDQAGLKTLLSQYYFFSLVKKWKNLLTSSFKQIRFNYILRSTFLINTCYFRGPPGIS